MKYLLRLFKVVLFFVLFGFALDNQSTVSLHWLGFEWRLPLVVLLLMALLLGVVLGMAMVLPRCWRRPPRAPVASLPPTPEDGPHGI